jgi:anthranilate/para-aminobenzoate synthase component I
VVDGLRTLLDDSRIKARGKRAKAFLGDEVERIVLAQMFFAPTGASDPFDAYRAYYALTQAAHGYYIDFGESPAAPHMCMYGVSDTVLSQRRGGEPGSYADDIYGKLPDPTMCGEPPLVAMKLIRRLEENAHHAWGGAAGYSCPGGRSAFVSCDRVVSVQDGTYFHFGGVTMTEQDDPDALVDRCREGVKPALAAMKYAQKLSY